jgi:hypothetical protein
MNYLFYFFEVIDYDTNPILPEVLSGLFPLYGCLHSFCHWKESNVVFFLPVNYHSGKKKDVNGNVKVFLLLMG